MDWAISTCLIVFLSSLLSLLTDGTKLSSHINRVLGLICLLAVFSPLVTSLSNGEFFNLSEEIQTQQTFLSYIEKTYRNKTEETIKNIVIEQGITDYFNVEIIFSVNDNIVKNIVIFLKKATKEQESSISSEISKKLNVDERIISICSE